jgi:type IV pilus assembly protein PilM
MNFWHRLTSLVKDPPPELVCELSEAGIAYARMGEERQVGFAPLEPGVLRVSPVEENVLRPDVLASEVRKIAGESTARKRRPAAIILPDYCARLTVIDFDSFPTEPAEQVSLVRFRVKKTVPYDVETAAVQYFAQPRAGHAKKLDVVVGLIPMDILARYEAPFRAAGLQPGSVTTSTMAALGLLDGEATGTSAVSLVAKLTGHTLTVCALRGTALRMVRTVDLANITAQEINAVLYPTVAYIEDELAGRPSTVYLCGFESIQAELGGLWEAETGLSATPLESPLGAPGEYRAGLFGYLRALEAF